MLKRLLVVDDDDLSRDILADLFEEKYEIIHCKDGRQAMSAISIQFGQIEAVLLDLVMPNMDGFEFLQKLAEKGWNKKFPVIVISGNDEAENRQRCNKMGVKYFISKPYSGRKARAAIEEAISGFPGV